MLSVVFTIFTIAGCQPNEDGGTNKSSGQNPGQGKPPSSDMPDIPATEFIKNIKTGWNLGNTLDVRAKGLTAETGWGNPRTTPGMIQVIADAGFDSVRVPVSWEKHMGEAPDYLIEEEWMDRVQEVVGYVLDTGMYCIVNTHHEDWIFPDEANESQNTEQLIAVWKQICARFGDYSEKLIFEGMNEPRLMNTSNEWNGGNAEAHGVVNRLNQAFVDTVRNSGGNNTLRQLIIPTYAASSEGKAMSALRIPENDDKIIVSIHAYTPYNFALKDNGTPNWSFDSPNDTNEVDWMFNRIVENFTSKGIPVILGETGAVNRNGNLQARVEWAEYYFGKAKELGIPCYWWDNGLTSGGGELFGLLNRREERFEFPEIVESIMK